MEYLDAAAFLERGKLLPIVDVRSPGEFCAGHMMGAHNIPLFTDSERAAVGTTYKEQGKEKAIEEGLGFVGPKLQKFGQKALALAAENQLLVHCWRGGMRSGKMAELFELHGIKCGVLEGGYKAFRRHLHESFENLNTLVILSGATGSGKTVILHELKKLGEQVIDLEGLANHRGSAFGGIDQGDQPTTEQFQNALFAEFYKMEPTKRIWLESESMNVGRVNMPGQLWDKMNNSSLIEINVPKQFRVERLILDYGHLNKALLIDSIDRIAKRLGGLQLKKVKDAFETNDKQAVAELLLDYYDKSYRKSRDKYKTRHPAEVSATSGDARANAQLLIEKANNLHL